MYVPLIQTKQFPTSWAIARKTRLGPQQYLLTTTANGQMTLLIFLSQNGAFSFINNGPYNTGNIIPMLDTINDSLIYSTVLFTCPESTNLGLTFANSNLQMVTAAQQAQIWHRVNTSLLGDTVQVGFTLNDSQMRFQSPSGSPFVITGATQSNPCVLTCANKLSAGSVIQIKAVVGMTQLNFNPAINNNYYVQSANSTTITIQVDSTTFSPYISGGIVNAVTPINAFGEIELHSIILDVNASQLLA